MPCLATSPSGWLPWWESLPELPSELPALPCRWNQPDPDPTRDSRGKRSHHKGPETDRNRRTADMLSHLLLRSALDYVGSSPDRVGLAVSLPGVRGVGQLGS